MISHNRNFILHNHDFFHYYNFIFQNITIPYNWGFISHNYDFISQLSLFISDYNSQSLLYFLPFSLYISHCHFISDSFEFLCGLQLHLTFFTLRWTCFYIIVLLKNLTSYKCTPCSLKTSDQAVSQDTNKQV